MVGGGKLKILSEKTLGLVPESFVADRLVIVLDIIAATPFAALTLRSLMNERGDFLMTTFPVADLTTEAPSPIVFPHVADGGGYLTEFILISAGGAASTALNLYDDHGSPTDFSQR